MSKSVEHASPVRPPAVLKHAMDQLLSAAYEVSGDTVPKMEQAGMDGGYPAPPAAEPSTAHHSEEESLLAKLREFVESKGEREWVNC